MQLHVKSRKVERRVISSNLGSQLDQAAVVKESWTIQRAVGLKRVVGWSKEAERREERGLLLRELQAEDCIIQPFFEGKWVSYSG